MNKLTEALQSQLRARGYRLTKPRRAVLETLVAEPTHLRPEELYTQARRRYRKLGIVTVYRTVTLLEQLGLVQRVHLDSTRCQSFALVRSAQGHHHQLVCRDCGRVEEFSDCALEGTLEGLQKRTGFSIETHHLEVIGQCPECQ